MGRAVNSLVISILILMTWCVAAASSGDLWSKFTSPDPRARTKVWWFHGETETPREAVDADGRFLLTLKPHQAMFVIATR